MMAADWIRDAADGHWISVADYTAELGVDARRLPRSVRIILEAALKGCAESRITADECATIARWTPGGAGRAEWRFPIGRVLMQDASGLPLLADLAALRDAVAARGRDPAAVDMAVPATLVIDHSIDANHWGSAGALARNMDQEFAANAERYAFARWAEQAFDLLDIVPPGNGIVHQVHLERVAGLVSARDGWTLCDSVIGTDSHTTMVNGIGILGWGVGGIEAEAALLGQPLSLAPPRIVGIELVGAPGPGIFGADLALAITARLRKEQVVGAFVEFFGEGVAALGVADRNSIANMAPEYGATLALFPADEAVLDYLRAHGRSEDHLAKARRHLIRQGLFDRSADLPDYDHRLRIDLAQIMPSLAGPSLPHQHVALTDVADSFADAYPVAERDGRILLAAITSCTNTANLRSLVAAALLARNALAQGMRPPSYVKTVFAPGSRETAAALTRMGLLQPLEAAGFHIAAYGCGPCVGNTGDLADGVEAGLVPGAAAVAILSGNRNFEGRIHRAIRAAYLANPMLVVAYALAGRIDADITDLIARLAPEEADIASALAANDGSEQDGWHLPAPWSNIPQADGPVFDWRPGSTFFVPPPFFPERATPALHAIERARPLLVLGDAVTTDHISPVCAIARDSAAARYLADAGVAADALGSYSMRRVNHDVMLRGTFANPRLRNRLTDRPGPVTRAMPGNATLPIHEAAARYAEQERPAVILAGHLYGAGSARDWAAKGTALLGISAVIARSFERIHRSNLVALGILPIEVHGDDDPWERIGPESDVEVSVAIDPDAVTVNMPVTVQLVIDGQTRLLQARLLAATNSEIAQLRTGTLFDICLRDALR